MNESSSDAMKRDRVGELLARPSDPSEQSSPKRLVLRRARKCGVNMPGKWDPAHAVHAASRLANFGATDLVMLRTGVLCRHSTEAPAAPACP